MPTAGTSQFPKWVADAAGALVALVTLGVIVYFLGVKAQLWPSPSGGFWIT